jgi:hypothetical protein
MDYTNLPELKICFGQETDCTELIVEWISKEGFIQPCPEEDNCIIVKPDPDATGERCMEGWVFCADCETGNCEPIYFKRCYCETDEDCLECQECDPETNICIDICTQDDLDKGKICTNTGCECPPDKPYISPFDGSCVECIEGTTDPNNPCLICKNGKWEEKTCGDGKCDPTSGICEECLLSSDCANRTDGKNCCDPITKKCKCCEGQYFDYVDQRCKPIPECTAGDCPECFDCVEVDGIPQCVPINCGPGKICVPGKGCVPICDCGDNTTCDDKQLCIELDPNNCYCDECEGDCDSGCGEGCYCNGIECVPNPCLGSCKDGTDCGEGCGCDENEQCVPCDSVSCEDGNTDCAKILGCECKNNGRCGKVVDCDTDCTNKDDCEDPCGCDDAICKHCGNYDCDECAKIDGCICTDGENCVYDNNNDDDDCIDTLDLSTNGCSLITTALLNNLCPCSALSLTAGIDSVSVANDDNSEPTIYEFSIIVSNNGNQEFSTGKTMTDWGIVLRDRLINLYNGNPNVKFRSSIITDNALPLSRPMSQDGSFVTDTGILHYGIYCYNDDTRTYESTPAFTSPTSSEGQFYRYVSATNVVTDALTPKPNSYDLINDFVQSKISDIPDVNTTETSHRLTFNVSLRKGVSTSYNNALTLPLLKDTTSPKVIDNDAPSGGSIRIKVTTHYRELNNLGTVIGRDKTVTTDITKNVINKDKVIFSDIEIPIPGYLVRTNYEVDYVEVKFYQNADLEFNNQCEYNAVSTIGTMKFDEDTDFILLSSNSYQRSLFGRYKVLTTDSSRQPVFTYTKTINDVETVFRKVYVAKKQNTSKTYEDILYGPGKVPDGAEFPLASPDGELWAKTDYTVSMDCGCANPDSLEGLQICDIEFEQDVNYLLKECNTKFEGLTSFTPCPINRKLSDYEEAGYTIPDKHQTEYLLYIDGAVVATFVYSSEFGELVTKNDNTLYSNFKYSSDESIKSIKLAQNHGDKCDVAAEFTLDVPVPTYSTVCGTGLTYSVNINVATSDSSYTVSSVVVNNNTYLPTNNIVTVTNLLKDEVYQAKINYSNGCFITLNIQEDCCSEATVSVDLGGITFILEGSSVEGTVITSGFAGGLQYFINNTSFDGPDFVLIEDGEYTIRVIDSLGCEQSTTFILGLLPDDSVFEIDPANICDDGSTSTLTITGTPNAAFIYKTPTGATVSDNLDSLGTRTYSVSDPGVYTLTYYNGFTANKTTLLNIVDVPQLIGFTVESGPYCVNEPVQFTITGDQNSAGAVVSLSYTNTEGPPQLVLDGNSQAILTFTPLVMGNHSVVVNSLTLGSCITPSGSSLQIEAFDNPQISSFTSNCQTSSPTSPINITILATANSTLTMTVDGNDYNNFVENSPGTYTQTVNDFGTASVTVDNGGCQITQSFTVSQCNCPSVNPPQTTSATKLFCGSAPQTVVTKPAGTTVIWYDDIGLTNQIDTGTNFTPPVNISARYYAVAEDANGCQSNPLVITYSLITVTINGFIYSTNTNSVCAGDSVDVEVDAYATWEPGFPGVVSLNYQWYDNTNGSGAQLGTNRVQTLNWDEDTFSVMVTASGTSCSAIENGVIVEDTCDPCYGVNISLGSISASSQTVCANQSFTVTAINPSGGTAPYRYLWYAKNVGSSYAILGSSVPTSVNVITTSRTQDSMIAVKVYDANDCVSDFFEIGITVNPLPTININNIQTTCITSLPLTATIDAGGGTNIWSVIDSPNGSNPTITPSGGVFSTDVAGSYTIHVIHTNANGCIDFDSQTFQISELITQANIPEQGPFCENELNVQLVGTPAGGYWSATCGTCINSTTGEFSPSQAGLGMEVISYSISSNNCTDVATREIVINEITAPIIYPVDTATNPAYSGDGTRFVASTSTLGVSIVNNVVVTSPSVGITIDNTSSAWGGRTNLSRRLGLCAVGYNKAPANQILYFVGNFNIPVTGTYSIGFGIDNEGDLYIDNQLVFAFSDDAAGSPNDVFTKWWVIERNFTAGDHCIRIEGKSYGNAAAAGFEIYNGDLATVQTYSSIGEVNSNLIASSRGALGYYECGPNQTINNTVCPPICDCGR